MTLATTGRLSEASDRRLRRTGMSIMAGWDDWQIEKECRHSSQVIDLCISIVFV